MIAYLKGSVLYKSQDFLILQTPAGIGYKVFVNANIAVETAAEQNLELYIYTQYKENDVSLFGFASMQEQKCFEILLGVQGVGAKMAQAILSALNPEEIYYAIAAGEKQAFTQVSGIGPKLANRLVNELTGKIELPASLPATAVTATRNNSMAESQAANKVSNQVVADVVSALANMGFVRSQALQVVSRLHSSNQTANFEDIFKQAIAELSSAA
jgi:Holliday junction DNA helicase RuvA